MLAVLELYLLMPLAMPLALGAAHRLFKSILIAWEGCKTASYIFMLCCLD